MMNLPDKMCVTGGMVEAAPILRQYVLVVRSADHMAITYRLFEISALRAAEEAERDYNRFFAVSDAKAEVLKRID